MCIVEPWRLQERACVKFGGGGGGGESLSPTVSLSYCDPVPWG